VHALLRDNEPVSQDTRKIAGYSEKVSRVDSVVVPKALHHYLMPVARWQEGGSGYRWQALRHDRGFTMFESGCFHSCTGSPSSGFSLHGL